MTVGAERPLPPHPSLLRALARAVEIGCRATDPEEWPEAVWLTSYLDSPDKTWHAVISLPDGVPMRAAEAVIQRWAERIKAREVLEFAAADGVPHTIMAVAHLAQEATLEVCICPGTNADAAEELRDAAAARR